MVKIPSFKKGDNVMLIYRGNGHVNQVVGTSVLAVIEDIKLIDDDGIIDNYAIVNDTDPEKNYHIDFITIIDSLGVSNGGYHPGRRFWAETFRFKDDKHNLFIEITKL